MHPESITLHRVAIELTEPMRSAHGIEQLREVLIVELETDVGVGWGECAALTAPTYTAEHTAGALAAIAQRLGPALLRFDTLDPTSVSQLRDRDPADPMAAAALEMAVLDAWCRSERIPLATYLGASSRRIASGVVIGVLDEPASVVAVARQHAEAGYRRIKLKIAPGSDVAPLRAVREALGDVVLAADANGSYSNETGPPDEIDDLALECVEQPFASFDLDAHAALARRWRTPICLDESIVDIGSLDRAADAGACSIVNVKPGRLGGYLAARALHLRAMDRGLRTFVGGMLETALGRAAAIALAARPGMDLAHDLSASDRYFREDLGTPFVLREGTLEVPRVPGVGRVPDPGVLARHTVERVVVGGG